MKHLDLFSGIGGFALAARWAGIETVQFVEIEPFAQKVLNKNFPNIPIHDDIKTFKADEFSGIGIITGGYPCQPFSQAGQRRGEKDDRHLWPEMFRVIREARPDWVLAENVAGHVSMGLDDVLDDLEGEGYITQSLIIPACAKDAKHRRDRVWIVANSEGVGNRRDTGKANGEKASIQGQKVKIQSGLTLECSSKDDGRTLANLHDSGRKVHGGVWGRQSEVWSRKMQVAKCSSGTGREVWAVEPNVGRVAHGIPSRVDRLRGLGNSVVPQVAYEIMKGFYDTNN